MIIRTILYVLMLGYFLWDYRKEQSNFKKYIFPVAAITYFAGSKYYQTLDNRLKLTIFIITFLLGLRYLMGYYNDYKIKKFQNKKYLRRLREAERNQKQGELLKEILESKNSHLRKKSSSYEISMDLSQNLQIKGQMNLFGELEENNIFDIYERNFNIDEKDEKPPREIDNQLGMFPTDKRN